MVLAVPVVPGVPASSQSIICQLEEKSCVQFVVNIGFTADFCVGSVIRNADDTSIFDFNSVASTFEVVADFAPGVGCVVAALSPEYSEWFRACVLASNERTYSVTYVDFGNCEDGIVAVKPIPESFGSRAELAVKLSLMEGGILPSVLLDKLLPETNHSLKIVGKEDDFLLAEFQEENSTICRIRLEPWTSLVKPQRIIEERRREPGFNGEVILTAVDKQDDIYVLFDKDIPVTEEIQSEMRIISASCPLLSCPPAVGSYVVAFFPEDGEFYRAKVLSVDGQSIRVHYIDFGNSAVVGLAELKALPDSMWKYPACSTRVVLNRVPRPLGALPADVVSYLEDRVNHQFTIVVLASSDASYVECTLSEGGQVLNDSILELIETGQHSVGVEETQLVQVPEAAVAEAAVAEVIPVEEDVRSGGESFGEFFYDEGEFHELPAEGEFQALILTCSPQCIMMCAADESVLLKLDQLQVNRFN